ncbi:MAG: ABC-2 transporter permease [Christensenellaceae bacterium]|jgi:hypothetical protein|nr:ABC-2 transporter permease [Christensenellaceae bacterium]
MRNKIFALLRLDFATVRPYFGWKQGLLYLAVVLLLTFFTARDGSSAGSGSIAGILAVFAVLNASLPFNLAERNNLDVLYASLSVSRKQLVLGRYGFSLLSVLGALLAGAALSFLIWAGTGLGGPSWALEYFSAALALFLLFSLVLFVQLPVYFKLGYTKAKLLSYLPILLMAASVAALGGWQAGGESAALRLELIAAWLKTNPGAPLVLGITLAALWLLLGALSCHLSIRFYERRDF